MRLAFLAAVPLLLAACARSPAPPTSPVADSPEVAACRTEARNSPEVCSFSQRMNLANPTQMARTEALRDEAESRLFSDCLRRRGISRGGGVERVRPPGIGL
jgi:hypothetical protein